MNEYNAKSNLDCLLRKYHKGTADVEEFKELIKQLNASNDEEIRESLQLQWKDFDSSEDLPESKISAIYDAISKKTGKQQSLLLKNWQKIAAAILLLIVSGTTFLYLHQQQSFKQMAMQTFTIKSDNVGKSGITLPDGTTVLLNAHSSLQYGQDFGQKKRVVTLKGEGLFDVSHDTGHPFIVKTQNMDIQVLGTLFNVYVYENKNTQEVSLLRGHVRVSSKKAPFQVLELNPNQKIVMDRRTGKMTVESAKNGVENSWAQKTLVFKHESMQNIILALERKFNVSIEVQNSQFLKDTYTGTFDDSNIKSILDVLQMSYHFTYQVKGDHILIKK